MFDIKALEDKWMKFTTDDEVAAEVDALLAERHQDIEVIEDLLQHVSYMHNVQAKFSEGAINYVIAGKFVKTSSLWDYAGFVSFMNKIDSHKLMVTVQQKEAEYSNDINYLTRALEQTVFKPYIDDMIDSWENWALLKEFSSTNIVKSMQNTMKNRGDVSKFPSIYSLMAEIAVRATLQVLFNYTLLGKAFKKLNCNVDVEIVLKVDRYSLHMRSPAGPTFIISSTQEDVSYECVILIDIDQKFTSNKSIMWVTNVDTESTWLIHLDSPDFVKFIKSFK